MERKIYIMNKMIQTTKSLYPEYLCLFKIGTFYCAYNRDAYIMSYLFKYKIREKKDEKEVGFPVDSINKIKARLEQEKINYILVETSTEYDVTEKQDLNNSNKYNEIYAKARNYINYKLRVDAVYKIMLDMINEKDFRKTLAKVEEIVYGEEGKV